LERAVRQFWSALGPRQRTEMRWKMIVGRRVFAAWDRRRESNDIFRHRSVMAMVTMDEDGWYQRLSRLTPRAEGPGVYLAQPEGLGQRIGPLALWWLGWGRGGAGSAARITRDQPSLLPEDDRARNHRLEGDDNLLRGTAMERNPGRVLGPIGETEGSWRVEVDSRFEQFPDEDPPTTFGDLAARAGESVESDLRSSLGWKDNSVELPFIESVTDNGIFCNHITPSACVDCTCGCRRQRYPTEIFRMSSYPHPFSAKRGPEDRRETPVGMLGKGGDPFTPRRTSRATKNHRSHSRTQWFGGGFFLA
jgi:hypothetical protein